jgi:hypothetical protein
MFNLLPKDDRFSDELEQLSDRVVSTAKQFEAVVSSFPNFYGQLSYIEQYRLAARKIANHRFDWTNPSSRPSTARIYSARQMRCTVLSNESQSYPSASAYTDSRICTLR